MPKPIKIHVEIFTHEHLWRSSTALITQAEIDPDNSDRLLLPALLLSILAFEAFVNFCGYVLAPELWAEEKKNFKGKGLEAKLSELDKRLPSFHWKKGEALYQSIKDLEAFRDMVAHGKVVSSRYETERRDDGTHFRFEHAWDEYISLKAVITSRDNIIDFSQSLIVAARKISDEPHLEFDAYEGPLGSAVGISKSGYPA